jgi:HD-GYP domain-containing protein (c-di-GMP phosphodiesterase class II)
LVAWLAERRAGSKRKKAVATRFLIAAEGDASTRLVESTAAMNGVKLVGTATSHGELVAACARLQPDVALVDMALLGGEQPLAEVHRRSPDTRVVVVATRLDGPGQDLGRALIWGAAGVVYRDASAAELVPVFENASRLTELTGDVVAGKLLSAYAGAVAEKRSRDLATIQTLAAAVEFKDATTAEHLHRVSGLAARCLDQIDSGLAADEAIVYGFTLHDIGKIGIPDAILTKPGPLTDAEWKVMHQHPEMGAEIVRPLGFPDRTLQVILHHHERFDGGGYPGGLVGDEIPVAARVFAIADAYDAMTSDRPYRKAMPRRLALQILTNEGGHQFDPDAVSVFTQLAFDANETHDFARPRSSSHF